MKLSALSFAINDYPGAGNDLDKCLLDQEKIKSRLERVGFEVSTFSDSYATSKNLTANFKEIVSPLKSGDKFVWHYSGHGSYQLDKNGDEQDGYDEVICLHDRDFADDEMRALFDLIPAGVEASSFMDCCFSGTNTRALLFGKVRKVRFRPPKTPLIPFIRHKKSFIRSFEEETMNHINFSGCTDEQYSYEGNDGGAFTDAICRIIDVYYDKGLSINFAHLAQDMTNYLPSKEFPQNPQLEGQATHKMNWQVPFLYGVGNPVEPPDDGPEPPPDEPDPPEPIPWYKNFWNSLFGWFWYWKKIDE